MPLIGKRPPALQSPLALPFCQLHIASCSLHIAMAASLNAHSGSCSLPRNPKWKEALNLSVPIPAILLSCLSRELLVISALPISICCGPVKAPQDFFLTEALLYFQWLCYLLPPSSSFLAKHTRVPSCLNFLVFLQSEAWLLRTRGLFSPRRWLMLAGDTSLAVVGMAASPLSTFPTISSLGLPAFTLHPLFYKLPPSIISATLNMTISLRIVTR